MLPPDQTQRIREKYREYVTSPRFERDFLAMHPRLLSILIVIVIFIMKFQPWLAVSAIRSLHRRGFASNRLRRKYIKLADEGVAVVAYAAMFNAQLRGSSMRYAPAMLVASLSEGVKEDEIRNYANIAGSVDLMAETAEEEQLAKILEDDSYHFRRRRAFPPAMTNGHDVYAFDVLIAPEHVPASRLETPRIICLVDPRPNGMILALPHEVAAACGLAESQATAVNA